MKRNVFYSFHFDGDNWRAGQVRNMGVIEGNQPASDNDWESVKRGGDAAIKRWIDDQMSGRSCAVVLIGAATAGRKWINHEIEKAWNDGKGLVGIYVHNLEDQKGNTSLKGANPFSGFQVNRTQLASIVRAYDPPHSSFKKAYASIKENFGGWVEEAIQIRSRYA